MLTPLRIFLLTLLSYFTAGWIGLQIPAVGSSVTMMWLPSGIAVGCFYRWGFQYWPAVSLAAFTVNLFANSSMTASAGIAVGNTMGPLITAFLLKTLRFNHRFEKQSDIGLLALATHLGMLFSASVGACSLWLEGTVSGGFFRTWWTWWISDSMGVISTTPLVMLISRTEFREIQKRLREFSIWILFILAVTAAVFVFNSNSGEPAWALAFVPLPFVAWASLRFGPIGTAVAIIVVSAGSAYGTSIKAGPFYREDLLEQVGLLWTYMATTATLGWITAALQLAQLKSINLQRVLELGLYEASVGCILTDVDRRITYINSGFTQLTGFTASEILGKNCSFLQGPDTDAESVLRLREALETAGSFDGEILNYRKDGTSFWNALLISPINNENGERVGFLGIQRDVTKRKLAETAVQQSEMRLRTVLELEPECVKIVSRDGRLIEMNPAGLAMIEADSLQQVAGAELDSLIEPSHREEFRELHRKVIRGQNGICQFPIVGLKGTKRWLESHAVPFCGEDGNIIGLLSVTRDITSRKLAEDSLRLSEDRYRGFVENSSTGLYLYELDKPISTSLTEDEQITLLMHAGHIALANDAHARMYGFERGEQLTGKRAFEFYRTDENEANQAFLSSFIRNGYLVRNAVSEEFDRNDQFVSFSNDLLGIVENGYLVRIWGTQRDITSQRRFEVAIRTLLEITAASELPFKEQLSRILQLGCSQFSFTHGTVIRLAGQAQDVLQSWHSSKTQPIAAGASSESTRVFESDITIADTQVGILRFTRSTNQTSTHDTLDNDLLTLMARWIGSQMQLQTTLSQQRAIVENSPDYIIMLNRNNRITFINRSPSGQDGMMIRAGSIFTELISESSRHRAEDCLKSVWETGRPDQFETCYESAGQSHLYLEARVTPVLDGAVIRQLLVTATDVTARRNAEVLLEQNRNRLKSILNSIQEVVYSCSPDGSTMLLVSDYCEAIYGVEPGAFMSDPHLWLKLVHPDDMPIAEQMFATLQEADSYNGEYRIIRKDGGIRWVSDRGRIVRDDNATPIRLDGVVTDITDRKQSEEQLVESERRYRTLFKNNPQPMWVYDLETLQFLAVNTAAVEHYGYSREEFLSMTIRDIRPPDDVPRLLKNLARNVRGLDKAGLWRHQTKCGRIIQVEITAHTMGFDGRPAELVLAYDVTERQRLEEEIFASQQKFQAIVEKSHDLILIIDGEGTIQFANPALSEVLGFDPEEVIGQKNLSFVVSDDVPFTSMEQSEVNTNPKKDFRNEFRARHKDGSWRTIEAVGINLLDVPGLSGLVVNCRDITERKVREIRTLNERSFFELLTTGASLEEIFHAIAAGVESLATGMKCSILLLDHAGERLRTVTAPSLPEAYCRAIDGQAIGPEVGSCGTAAFRKTTVIVSDIATDPLWTRYRDFALPHGLRACWSIPMLSSEGRVLGTLAMYYSEPRTPTASELESIERAAKFAVLAVERHQILESLRDSRVRLESLISNLPGMAYRCDNDPNWTMSFVSSGCENVTGYSKDELENNRVLTYGDLIHPDDRDWLWAKCQSALEARIPCSNMYRLRDKDGQIRWVRERASGVYDSEGNLLFIDGFIQDVTESQKNDEQIRASLREKEAMLKEIHHRVKNNLQIVTSLLNLQVDRLSDPTVVSELRESQNRVRSMALVHETLYTTGNLGRINLSEYVHALCRHLFRSFGVDSSNIRLVLDVATISLDLERTIPFGLIINELVSNALKYAFKPGESGEIVVSLSRQSNENYVLLVKDDGVGFGVGFEIEKATSLGLKLIEDLTHQLSGTLAVSGGKGAGVCITFPIGASE